MSIAPFHEEQQQQASPAQEDDAKEDVESSEDSEDHEDDDEDEDESESEDEEVIARKLNEQLLEDIRRARADAAPPIPVVIRRSPKEEVAFTTMKTVLAFAASDSLVHATLAGTAVPGHPSSNVLEMLNKITNEGRITPQIAGPLSHVLVKLAKSDVLFSPLPSLPSQILKRKRDEREEVTGPPTKAYHDSRYRNEGLQIGNEAGKGSSADEHDMNIDKDKD